MDDIHRQNTLRSISFKTSPSSISTHWKSYP